MGVKLDPANALRAYGNIFDHTAEYVVGNEHEMIFQIVCAAKMSRGGNICIPNNNITFTHS